MYSTEIVKQQDIDSVINSTEVCYVGMVDGDEPYVLPFNYGYDGEYIWLHSGKAGRKHDIFSKNSKVCIAISTNHELHFRHEQVACSYSMKFKSIVINGVVEYVSDYDEKIKGMNIIMKHYTKKEFPYNKPAIDNVEIFKVKIERISARQRGYV